MFSALVFALPLVALVASASAKPASDAFNWMGNLSPYHKAPVPADVKEDLPTDCAVEQVMLVCVQLLFLLHCIRRSNYSDISGKITYSHLTRYWL